MSGKPDVAAASETCSTSSALRFSFTPEQQELRTGARRFLGNYSASNDTRRAMESAVGFDDAVWTRVSTELGWPALIIPEEYDGFGFGPVELAALVEEMGRALFCGPYFSSVCLAANALLAGGTDAHKQAHLPGIAAGETRATVALIDASPTTATVDGGEVVLSGRKTCVVDGHIADLILVAVGDNLFIVPATTPGVTATATPTMDATRKLADVTLDGARVPATDTLGDCVERTLNLARVALAAEQVGGAEACMDMAVEYARVRTQFDRPIGSFQAIKHKCADMLTRVETARSAVYYAAWAASVGDPELPLLAPMAAAYCSDAYFFCASENIQIHGGIGFTWEHDAHLYFKRARSSEQLLGSPAHHRELVAQRLGLDR